MIPRIAHFHWEGRPINWLRMMGIYSFARLNPRWEIRLHRTPDFIRARNLPCYANEADWTWILMLLAHGGFAMPTDTIFVKPVPDEWLEGDLCVCTGGGDNFFHNTFGSRSGIELLQRCYDCCDQMGTDGLDYQAMGVTLLQNVTREMGGLNKMADDHKLAVVEIPIEGLTPVRWNVAELCWGTEPLPITDDTVGVAWFGGFPMSKEREWDVPHKHAEAAIVKLAREMCP